MTAMPTTPEELQALIDASVASALAKKPAKGFGNAAQGNGYKYQVIGDVAPMLEMYLEPGKEIIAEPGAFKLMTPGIKEDMALGDGTQKGVLGKVFGATMRSIAGEDLLLAHFRNAAQDTQTVAFAAPYPGEIIDIDLNEAGGAIICQRGGFLAAPSGTNISLHLRKKIRTSLFGGEGFIMQKISGNEHVFLHAAGNMRKYKLAEGQQLRIDTGSLLAVTDGVDMDITFVRSLKSMIFGQEGLLHTTVTGPGTIWTQTTPLDRQIGQMVKHMEKHFKKTWASSLVPK
jgi:uncharacterized protein (TIGR00266 family)